MERTGDGSERGGHLCSMSLVSAASVLGLREATAGPGALEASALDQPASSQALLPAGFTMCISPTFLKGSERSWRDGSGFTGAGCSYK